MGKNKSVQHILTFSFQSFCLSPHYCSLSCATHAHTLTSHGLFFSSIKSLQMVRAKYLNFEFVKWWNCWKTVMITSTIACHASYIFTYLFCKFRSHDCRTILLCIPFIRFQQCNILLFCMDLVFILIVSLSYEERPTINKIQTEHWVQMIFRYIFHQCCQFLFAIHREYDALRSCELGCSHYAKRI